MNFENPGRGLPPVRTIKSELPPIVEALKLGLAQFRRTFSPPGENLTFADVGCGSGVVAIHLGKFFPGSRVFAWDANTETFGREFKPETSNITVQKADILSGLPAEANTLDGITYSMVAPLLSDDENRFVCNEIVRCAKDRSLVYVVNTHHVYQSLIARTVGALGEGLLAANQTLESDHVESEYSAERFLRGEHVLPEILKGAGIQIRAVIDIEGTSASLSLLGEVADRPGSPASCPVMRAFICQVRK
jgi:SAM-dependent methyltransferase